MFVVVLWLAVVSEAGSQLENARWQLRDCLAESGEMTRIAETTTIDATFAEGQIRGSSGCNRYFAGYHRVGDEGLTLSEVGSTRRTCPLPVMKLEQRYLTLLSRVAAWRGDGRTLTLLDRDRRTLLRYEVAEPARLAGTAWTALAINNGRGGVVATATTHLSEVTFEADGAHGVAGCNRFTAGYEVKGDRVTFRDIEAGRERCREPAGVMEQEEQLLEALRRARRWTMSSDRLELRDDKGSLQVSLRPRDTAGDGGAVRSSDQEARDLGHRVLAVRDALRDPASPGAMDAVTALGRDQRHYTMVRGWLAYQLQADLSIRDARKKQTPTAIEQRIDFLQRAIRALDLE